MKTIEERAKEYCEKNIPNQPDMHFMIAAAFEAGAESEHAELTRWNDPKEALPENEARLLNKNDQSVTIDILVKTDCGSIFNNRRCRCLRGDEFAFWDWVYSMEGESIVGWREIHE